MLNLPRTNFGASLLSVCNSFAWSYRKKICEFIRSAALIGTFFYLRNELQIILSVYYHSPVSIPALYERACPRNLVKLIKGSLTPVAIIFGTFFPIGLGACMQRLDDLCII